MESSKMLKEWKAENKKVVFTFDFVIYSDTVTQKATEKRRKIEEEEAAAAETEG